MDKNIFEFWAEIAGASRRMNARRGLFRMWIVATFGWILYWSWKFYANCYQQVGFYCEWKHGFATNYSDMGLLATIVWTLILGPVSALLGGLIVTWIVRWIVRGFRRERE